MTPDRTSALTIACLVRPALVLEPIDAKIETLRACERDGVVDSLLLRSWPGEVAMVEDSPHPEVLEQYERFADWAERADVEIHPAFQRRETTSVVTDDTVERLVTPTIALACYRGDELVGVFPHTDGETTNTVPEAIATLRTGELPELLRERAAVADPSIASAGTSRTAVAERSLPRPAGVADGDDVAVDEADGTPSVGTRSSCPNCGGVLTNVQGILDCGGCEWRAERVDAQLAAR